MKLSDREKNLMGFQDVINKNYDKDIKQDFNYVNKFKSAAYSFILFIIFSHKVAYKVLDLIINIFTNKIDIIDDNDTPLITGSIIFGIIIFIIIFLF